MLKIATPFETVQPPEPEGFDLGAPFRMDFDSLGLDESGQLLEGLVTGLSQRTRDTGVSLLKKFDGPMGWLKDQKAVANSRRYRREDFTNGLSRMDEVEQGKIKGLVEQVERDLPDLQKLKETDLAKYMETVRGLIKSRPDSPVVAELARPNKGQLAFNLALAILSPGATPAILQGMMQAQVQERDRQQGINDQEFESTLAQIDAQIGLEGQAFESRQGTLQAQMEDAMAKDRMTIAQANELVQLAEQQKNRLAEIAALAEKEGNVLKVRTTTALIEALSKGGTLPSAIPGLMRNAGLFTDEEIDAAMSESAARFDANVFKTNASALNSLASANLSDIRGREIEFLQEGKKKLLESDARLTDARTHLTGAQREQVIKATSLMDDETAIRFMNAQANMENAKKQGKADPSGFEGFLSQAKQSAKESLSALQKTKYQTEQDIAGWESFAATANSKDKKDAEALVAKLKAQLAVVERQIEDTWEDIGNDFDLVPPMFPEVGPTATGRRPGSEAPKSKREIK